MQILTNKKNYFYSIFSGFGVMIITNVISVITVPISLSYWKPERYGLWALLSSIIVYLNLSNFGINSAAQILIAKNNDFGKRVIIFKRSLNILIITVFLSTIAICVVNLIENQFFLIILGKIPIELKREAYWTCVILIVSYLVNLPLTLCINLLLGFQKEYIENVFKFFIPIFNILSILITIRLEGSLITFACIKGATDVLLGIARFVYTYFYIIKKYNYLELSCTNNVSIKSDFEISYKNIIVVGFRFVQIWIASLLIWNTDNFIISHFLSVESVTPYSITYRLYTICFSIIFLFSNSILPIMGKEFGLGNWEWINKSYLNLISFMTCLGGLIWIGSILFFKDIIYLWVGKNGYAGLAACFFFGAYAYILSILNLNSGLLTSFNYIKGTQFIALLEAVLKLFFSILLVQRFSITGLAISAFFVSTCSNFWIVPLLLKVRSQKNIKLCVDFIIKHFLFILTPSVIFSVLLLNSSLLFNYRIILSIIIVSSYLFFNYKLLNHGTKIIILNFLSRTLIGLKKFSNC